MSFTPPGSVIFVDDDAVIRASITQSMQLNGLDVVAYDDATAALAAIRANSNVVIISDIRMPGMDGLQFFHAVQAIDPAIPFILITGHGDVPMAVAALRDGAHDFIAKPFAGNDLIASIRRALELRQLELDNRRLRAEIAHPSGTSALIGETEAIVRLRETIAQIGDADVDVLIEGETGTGKDLVASLLHRRSPRRQQRFVTIACAALIPGVAEAQLFGDESADARRGAAIGQIESAHRGTLFIDDIDQLAPVLQPRIRAMIEDRSITPIAAHSPRSLDLRIVAASRRDLREAAAEGEFRKDLYYAINIVRLRLPPLRERRSDIPLLFAHFVDEACTQMRRPPPPLSDRARSHLLDHDWPGNVRELRSFAFQSVVGFDPDLGMAGDTSSNAPLPERMEKFEASVIRSVLESVDGKAAEAIARLGLPRKTFYDKLHRHGIDIAAYRR